MIRKISANAEYEFIPESKLPRMCRELGIKFTKNYKDGSQLLYNFYERDDSALLFSVATDLSIQRIFDSDDGFVSDIKKLIENRSVTPKMENDTTDVQKILNP